MERVAQHPWQRINKALRSAWWLLPGLVLFSALMGYQLWRSGAQGAVTAQDGMPLSPTMEEKYGVRFLDLRVGARGGLIDLRYRVVNDSKAKIFGHFTETSPLLIAEKDGRTAEVTIMGLHNHRVEAGRIYYVLYRNTGDVVRPGDLVTIQVGDLQLQHVVAH